MSRPGKSRQSKPLSDITRAPGNRPLLLGHRGARAVKTIPENTIASFDRALADGCDGFEFDVRLTADGEAVISHDPKVGGIEIASAAAKELPNLPRLNEVLARYRAAFLDIELKVAGLEKILIDGLRKHKPLRFVVSSFLPEALNAVQAMDQTIPLGLLCETKSELRRWKKFPAEFVIAQRELVSRELVNEIHAQGKKVMVWTVNTEAAMRRFRAWDVDGIISDETERLVTVFRR
jgi:glycerophosphoryl diester phosphodiesterase